MAYFSTTIKCPSANHPLPRNSPQLHHDLPPPNTLKFAKPPAKTTSIPPQLFPAEPAKFSRNLYLSMTTKTTNKTKTNKTAKQPKKQASKKLRIGILFGGRS